MRIGVSETPELIGRCRVYLDGVDVTLRCVAADDEKGVALLYPDPLSSAVPTERTGKVDIDLTEAGDNE